MTQRLHLVFGGELTDPARAVIKSVFKSVFKNIDDLHIVGIFRNYQAAYKVWRAKASPPEELG